MKKILMRMGKDPFTVATPEETLSKNLLGTNVGNALFQVASHKLLTTKESEVTAYKFTPSMSDVEWVNENFSVFVIPLANAFRISFKKSLDKHTEFIKKLKIPVVVLGVGIQADLDCKDFSHLKPIEKNIKDFCNAVLEKSPSIGVRGECTYQYLISLGYNDKQIKIIGCPSMFWHGSNVYVNKHLPDLYSTSKISFNLSPYAVGSEKLLQKVVETFSNVTYIPQNNTDLEELLYGHKRPTNGKVYQLIDEHFYEKNKVIFFVEPQKWINFLETCHFSIGTRIHGTIANIIAGTPAHIFVHDSRTKELADYFEIPYTPIRDIDSTNIKDLYCKSDYSGLKNNHQKRFDTIISFLNEHGLDNIFEKENKDILKEYNNKYYSTKYKRNVRNLKFEDKNTLINRVKYLHKEVVSLKKKK